MSSGMAKQLSFEAKVVATDPTLVGDQMPFVVQRHVALEFTEKTEQFATEVALIQRCLQAIF